MGKWASLLQTSISRTAGKQRLTGFKAECGQCDGLSILGSALKPGSFLCSKSNLVTRVEILLCVLPFMQETWSHHTTNQTSNFHSIMTWSRELILTLIGVVEISVAALAPWQQ
ncbi:hypothetical protein DL546_004505 [Coniochaeta pulveracea]|uniref:Uncharacterized protein n=1 Tax=Coniochaeta pulveracea TaxID=177199 RepID=A0A420YIM6_9PEZI|nr:hypothetical protein DL546_004505 [Coniochaeta pulveracea]